MKFPLYEIELLSSVPNEIQIGFMLYFKTFHFIQIIFGVVQKLWYPKTAFTPPFSRTFRAPAESGQGIMIMFSCAYMFINSGMQTFREPFAALSRSCATAAKHTHPYLQMSHRGSYGKVSVKARCSIEVVSVASGIFPVNFCPKCLL